MQIEFRNNQMTITGYVNVVGRRSKLLHREKMGSFFEIITPGTFKRALLLADNVELNFNHDRNKKLGSTKEGNVQLYEDSIGLRIKCTITDTEVINHAKNGNLSGWSFEFKTYSDKWVNGKDDIPTRYIRDLTLNAVSLLGVGKEPAYVANSLEIRSRTFNSLDIYEKEIELLKMRGEIQQWI